MTSATTYPFDTIVRIIDKIGNNYYQGSGVLISPDEVLTASHLVWTTGVGVATDVTVTAGYGTGVALGTFSGTVTHYNAINDANDLISATGTASDYAVIHLSSSTSLGSMSLGADFGTGAAEVSGYPSGSGQVNQAEQIATTSTNILTGQSLGAGSSGGPVWVPDGSGGGSVVGLVSTGATDGTGYFTKITSGIRSVIQGWVAQDDGTGNASITTATVSPLVLWTDSKTGASGSVVPGAAVGGQSWLQYAYHWGSTDSVAMATTTPNSVLIGGAGDDALTVTSGQNVLDGGSGSNFLVGGTGNDQFFTDARSSAVVWNTLENFHAGDYATLWGFSAGVSSYSWDSAVGGAAGYMGATLRANLVGGAGRNGDGIDASITFMGMSVQQAKGLIVTTGTQAAGPYLLLYNPGV